MSVRDKHQKKEKERIMKKNIFQNVLIVKRGK